MADGLRFCPLCQVSKLSVDFYFNGGRYSARCSECERKATAMWRDANREKKRAYDIAYKRRTKERRNELERKRLREDPAQSLRNNIRASIHKAMNARGGKKHADTEAVLGCGIDEFKAHIERQFARGMSWMNRHLWHIDHIIPLATAQTEDEVIQLNHFTNLRPLWAKDNLEKSDQVLYLI